MKNILTILMLCVFACACTNSETKRDKVKTDAEEQGLKGKVKSVRETEYKAVDKFGEVIIGELTDDDFYKYN
ncbi:MAG: hypothetical protein LBH82_07250, partial [Bacteroidales bacterium]|nr:hypothetical protein [Bacteroidales bacterium]